MSIVGRRHPLIDGGPKVTGALRFTADAIPARAVFAQLILSDHPSALVRRIDFGSVRRMPGVIATMSGADLDDYDLSGPEALLAGERVFYVGQPVATVVGTDPASVADAAGRVQVDYEPLPAVIDPREAMREDAPTVLPPIADDSPGEDAHGAVASPGAASGHPANVTAVTHCARGDAEAALRAAPVRIERSYRIPAVHQAFLEPHTTLACAEDGERFTIWTPTQGIFATRQMTADILGVPPSCIRVVPMPVGGAFGSKICLLEPLACLLSRAVARPVHIALSRREVFLLGRAGPAAIIDLRLGAEQDGRLSALSARIIFDNGASPGFTAGIAALLLGSTYRIPHLSIDAYEVATNKAPAGSYRAPGAPQAYFALESAIDELATRIGRDPIDLRLAHAVTEGDLRTDGKRWPRLGFVECLQVAREHPLYRAPRQDGEGIGVAAGGWLGGREPAAAACQVEPDGTVVLHLGAADITGTGTVLAMIAAEGLGVDLSTVRISTGDTATAPYSSVAAGSKTVYTLGTAVRQAVATVRQQLLEVAGQELEASPLDLILEGGEVHVRGVPSRGLSIAELAERCLRYDSAYGPLYGQGRTAPLEQSPMFTVHLARVRVDRETGQPEVTGYAAVQDVGRAINPLLIEGQIHGGSAQGMARALGEQLAFDGHGQLTTATFADYWLPTSDQLPPFDVRLVEIPSALGPFGAKGVAEPPAIPGAAAVANAIASATGVRICELPVTPEQLAVAHARMTRVIANARDSLNFEQYTVLALPAGPALSAELTTWMVDGLEKAMPTLNIRDYFLAKSSTFSDCDFVVVAVEHGSGEIISVLTSRWHAIEGDPPFLHVKILMITPRYQKTRLINEVWGFHLARVCQSRFGFPSLIALRTYNPVVFGAMRIFTRIDGIRMYPRIGTQPQDPAMARLARRIAEEISPGLEFVATTGVVRGAGVPPDFYPAMPATRKTDVYAYFAEHLTPSDRLLCLLSVDSEAARHRALQIFGVERLDAGLPAPAGSASSLK